MVDSFESTVLSPSPAFSPKFYLRSHRAPVRTLFWAPWPIGTWLELNYRITCLKGPIRMSLSVASHEPEKIFYLILKPIQLEDKHRIIHTILTGSLWGWALPFFFFMMDEWMTFYFQTYPYEQFSVGVDLKVDPMVRFEENNSIMWQEFNLVAQAGKWKEDFYWCILG